MIYLVLAILLVGVLVGSVGMRRLGALRWRTWRPGAALLALMALAVGVILLVRGDGWAGAVLLVVGVGLSLTARKRPALPVSPPTGSMGRREAASMLGVEADATPEQVEEAYRRLIRRAHPDLGGSPGLAAQLNLARATLSRPAAERGGRG